MAKDNQEWVDILNGATDEELSAISTTIHYIQEKRMYAKVAQGMFPTPNEDELRTYEFIGAVRSVVAYRKRTGMGLWDSKCVMEYHMSQRKEKGKDK